jgi:hypothetical protein
VDPAQVDMHDIHIAGSVWECEGALVDPAQVDMHDMYIAGSLWKCEGAVTCMPAAISKEDAWAVDEPSMTSASQLWRLQNRVAAEAHCAPRQPHLRQASA